MTPSWLPFCFQLLQHASCLGEVFKLAFGVETVWTVIFAFEFLEICAFPSYLLMFYAGRARPRAYLSRR